MNPLSFYFVLGGWVSVLFVIQSVPSREQLGNLSGCLGGGTKKKESETENESDEKKEAER